MKKEKATTLTDKNTIPFVLTDKNTIPFVVNLFNKIKRVNNNIEKHYLLGIPKKEYEKIMKMNKN